MAKLQHPLTGALYSLREDGLVEVDNNGLRGAFRFDGRHVSGELCMADPHLLLWLGGPQLPAEDEPWTNAPELGLLAKAFMQDTFNLPQVQKGLEAAQYDEVMLANYQETKIRHFHTLLADYLGQLWEAPS